MSLEKLNLVQTNQHFAIDLQLGYQQQFQQLLLSSCYINTHKFHSFAIVVNLHVYECWPSLIVGVWIITKGVDNISLWHVLFKKMFPRGWLLLHVHTFTRYTFGYLLRSVCMYLCKQAYVCVCAVIAFSLHLLRRFC